MATTTNFGWDTPDDTDLVKDGAAAIRTLGQSIDTSLVDLKGGTTDQVLAKNSGTDMDFKWVTDATGMANPMTTTGDTIYSSSGSTPARLGIGTAGQVLQVNSGATAPEWATPAAGGGMTLLSTTAITNIKTISITSIDQTYNELVIVMSDAATTSTGEFGLLRFNSNTTSGQYAFFNTRNGSDSSGYSDSKINFANNLSTAANTNSISSVIRITRYTDTTRKTIFYHSTFIGGSSSEQTLQNGTASFLGDAAISSVQFIAESSTWTAQGNIYIYGVK
jgi:hypothetical protein